jgi:hypothetical protein
MDSSSSSLRVVRLTGGCREGMQGFARSNCWWTGGTSSTRGDRLRRRWAADCCSLFVLRGTIEDVADNEWVRRRFGLGLDGSGATATATAAAAAAAAVLEVVRNGAREDSPSLVEGIIGIEPEEDAEEVN